MLDRDPASAAAGDEEAEAERLIADDEYAEAYGEPISHTLDLDTWEGGLDLESLYRRLEREVGDAIAQQRRAQQQVRAEIFPLLRTAADAPAEAGRHTAMPEDVAAVHRKVLFSGELETCDGTVRSHDTLVLTVTQIGICLISYQGRELAISQRLFRRDLRTVVQDPVKEARKLLRRRERRSAVGVQDRRDTLSELGRRGVMAYAERATLLQRSKARWRMGHGNIAPYELLTGSGNMKLLETALEMLRDLIAYQQWVFVPSSIKDRLLLTVGDALYPLEYAVVSTGEHYMAQIVHGGRYHPDSAKLADKFVRDMGPKVVVGIYRASAHSPATPFFAHADCVHDAAHIAIADSVLQEHRGFPLSIDLADRACASLFGPDTFNEAVETAYREQGEPMRYLNERETREK